MKQISFETTLNCSQQEVFEFHCDTNNLPLITPPWIKVKIISINLPLHVNSNIDLHIKRFGLTQRWLMKISKLEPNNEIIDEAVISPFEHFKHSHSFEKISETKTLMKDVIEFELPFTPFSNLLLPFIKKDMQKMFEYRHKKTREILC